MSSWIDEMRAVLPPERFSTRPSDLEAASRDESTLPPALPEAVAWPQTTEEVARLVRIACRHGVPLTARGAGSSLEGNPIPVSGGAVLDFTKMDQIVAVDPENLVARVQPGVVYEKLNRELRTTGLFFPPHPGGSAEVATIGGMVANNASGIYSVLYGGTREFVRGAVVVTGTGDVVRLGNPCRKSSSGYYLVGLLVGSEGTLALATELTIALVPLPESRRRAAYVFPGDAEASAAIRDAMRWGVRLAAAEFLDRDCVRATNSFLGDSLPEHPTVLLEFHGTPSAVGENRAAADNLCRDRGGCPMVDDGRVDRAWAARHRVTRAIQALRPEAQIVRADVAFPVSRLSDVLREARQLARARQIQLYAFGHAGLGILHVLVPAARADEAEWRAATETKNALIHAVLAMEGSVSAEHGIGLGNRPYAAAEHGPALALMQRIKQVFDPNGILNPGKIWDPAGHGYI